MIKSISLKFTEIPEPVSIPVDGVTIFVGPNNSGKSLVLRELESDISEHAEPQKKLLCNFEIDWPSSEELASALQAPSGSTHPGTPAGHLFVSRFNRSGALDSLGIPADSLQKFVKEHINERWIASQFLRFFLIRLDGRTRFDLTSDKPREDLIAPPRNILAKIFQDSPLRKRIRDIVYDAFGLYFTVEILSANSFRIRLSEAQPTADEQNFNDAARSFHAAAMHIKDASDGAQAFVGIICAVLASDYRTILIDEPEAFLHPPLARKLGYQLASTISANGGSLLASTHSADFLIGCLQASPSIRVVRLEYQNGRSKGQIVDSTAIGKLFKTPLLRSANVISALFHDGVVVTESDNDRVFYSEIYNRLAEQEKGYPSLLFIHAQNKQTIQDIIGPLRSFGVPAAAIVDIDVLKDGGQTWTGWLSSGQVPKALHNGLGQTRGDIFKAFRDKGINMKTDGGVDALATGDKAAANDFFDMLAEYGIFAVRIGELERWLPHLQAAGKKTDWVISALDKMGSDPTAANYLKPVTGDVWDFMRRIVGWIKNPARKGAN